MDNKDLTVNMAFCEKVNILLAEALKQECVFGIYPGAKWEKLCDFRQKHDVYFFSFFVSEGSLKVYVAIKEKIVLVKFNKSYEDPNALEGTFTDLEYACLNLLKSAFPSGCSPNFVPEGAALLYSLQDKIQRFIDSHINECALIARTKQTQPKNSSNRKNKESKVRDRLAQKLNGKTEVAVKNGWIDILTDTEVIEVKEATFWKHAVGQVIIYQESYPTRKKRIHLFGVSKTFDKQAIKSICQTLDIAVTYES